MLLDLFTLDRVQFQCLFLLAKSPWLSSPKHADHSSRPPTVVCPFTPHSYIAYVGCTGCTVPSGVQVKGEGLCVNALFSSPSS